MPVTLTRKPIFCLLLLLPLIYFPIFGHLDELVIDCWDEARLAVNAHEMNRTGNWIVTTYLGSPDMWNTKPPLMIWLQVICIKALGENELAIRFPSAIAAFSTCMLLFWFFAKKYNNALVGMLVCFVLITSEGYVRRHGIRTGDYDSLLTFFTTTFVLFWFLFVEEGKAKYFYIFVLTLVLSSLTKGVQPLIFLPALLIYTICRRKVISIIKAPHLYIGLLLFLLVVPGYYLLREHYNPGYIQAVFENELGGRYTTVIENHEGNFWFYHEILTNQDFKMWYVLAPIGIIAGVCSNDLFIKGLAIHIGLAAFMYLLILSLAATKIHWYDTPAIPLLSILTAIALQRLFASIKFLHTRYVALVYILTAVAMLLIPYRIVFNKVMGGETDYWENRQIAKFFQDALRGKEDIRGYYVAHGFLDQNITWYTEVLASKGLIKTRDPQHLDSGYKVIAYQSGVQEYLEDNYEVELLGHKEYVKKYYIKARRQARNVASY